MILNRRKVNRRSIIYIDEESAEFSIEHSDDTDNKDDTTAVKKDDTTAAKKDTVIHKDNEKEKTIADVYGEFTDEQKAVVEVLIAMAFEDGDPSKEDNTNKK